MCVNVRETEKESETGVRRTRTIKLKIVQKHGGWEKWETFTSSKF